MERRKRVGDRHRSQQVTEQEGGTVKRRPIYEKVVTAINLVITMIMFISACLLDSEDWVMFTVITLVCAGYLIAFGYATMNRREGS